MFQPAIAGSGLVGWSVLQRTLPRQTELFNQAPELVRDTDYFAQTIGNIDSAEDLVKDRRLLRVALGAFGLQDDINSQALIKRILQDDPEDQDTLVNRMADDRYTKLTKAFGFGSADGPRVSDAGFPQEINDLYRRQRFEIAVGDQDQTLRLAMNASRTLSEISGRDESENTKWFTIMGQEPLRKVFETALSLPQGFGQLDVDRQLEVFKERSESLLGLSSIDDLTDPEVLDQVIETYILRDQVDAGNTLSGGAIALTLLQSAASFYDQG